MNPTLPDSMCAVSTESRGTSKSFLRPTASCPSCTRGSFPTLSKTLTFGLATFIGQCEMLAVGYSAHAGLLLILDSPRRRLHKLRVREEQRSQLAQRAQHQDQDEELEAWDDLDGAADSSAAADAVSPPLLSPTATDSVSIMSEQGVSTAPHIEEPEEQQGGGAAVVVESRPDEPSPPPQQSPESPGAIGSSFSAVVPSPRPRVSNKKSLPATAFESATPTGDFSSPTTVPAMLPEEDKQPSKAVPHPEASQESDSPHAVTSASTSEHSSGTSKDWCVVPTPGSPAKKTTSPESSGAKAAATAALLKPLSAAAAGSPATSPSAAAAPRDGAAAAAKGRQRSAAAGTKEDDEEDLDWGNWD